MGVDAGLVTRVPVTTKAWCPSMLLGLCAVDLGLRTGLHDHPLAFWTIGPTPRQFSAAGLVPPAADELLHATALAAASEGSGCIQAGARLRLSHACTIHNYRSPLPGYDDRQ